MDPKMNLAAVGTGEHSAEGFAKLLIAGVSNSTVTSMPCSSWR